MFLLDSIKHSFVKVISFFPCGCCKANDILLFCSAYIFAQIHLMMSGSLELSEEKVFFVVGAQWKVEVGTNCAVNKFSWWLYPGVG